MTNIVLIKITICCVGKMGRMCMSSGNRKRKELNLHLP